MRRSLGICMSSVVVLAMFAAPAAAATRTRWVDDDGGAGPTGCGGDRPAARSIQAAIDASGPGDTIRVCDGNYVGSLASGTRPTTGSSYAPFTSGAR